MYACTFHNLLFLICSVDTLNQSLEYKNVKDILIYMIYIFYFLNAIAAWLFHSKSIFKLFHLCFMPVGHEMSALGYVSVREILFK